MATVHAPHHQQYEHEFSENDHPAWYHWDPEMRDALLEEDLSAARNVGIVLFSVIGFGLTLALITVAFITLKS